LVNSASPSYRDALLEQFLAARFGDIEPSTLQFLREHAQWVELGAGEVLMAQGAPGDSAYLSVSGRLRVYVDGDDGVPRPVRELGRGEVIGEMSLYTGEPRSATVVAIRNTLLARLAKPDFEQLVAREPRVSIAVTRQIIGRLQTQNLQHKVPAPVTLALLPISPGIPVGPLARQLAAELVHYGRVFVADAAVIEHVLEPQPDADEAARSRRIGRAIDRVEAEHDFVLLLAEGDDAWIRHCIGHADEVLLLADAMQPPELHPVEQGLLAVRRGRSEAAQILVLLHPAEQPMPRGVRAWLARRPLAGHINIRPALPRDIARLARIISRNATGLVFGGGGARGFAHLGVWRVLQQRGVEIDFVGGTSIGAAMAALVAVDAPPERAIEVARQAFRANPTGDFNLLPLISLIRGRRARRAIEGTIEKLAGGRIDIEDLWKGYFCVASNYSQGCEQRLADGDLGLAMRASGAIAGALPPVVREGDLLCDGGTFNNFPVDAMREQRGVGRVIGVDLGARQTRKLEFDEVPGSWALLLDRLKPRAKRRYRLPSLTGYLLNVTILYSISRQQESRRLTDLYFNPPLGKIGLLQWSRFEEIVAAGEKHAQEVLDGLDEAARAAIGLK